MYGFFGGRQIKFNLSPSDKNAQTNTANGSKSWITNSRLYTSREYDQELDLYYYRGRTYDAKMGRFIQRDPIGYADDVNLYTYVGNNPMNYTDPWGTEKKFIQKHDATNLIVRYFNEAGKMMDGIKKDSESMNDMVAIFQDNPNIGVIGAGLDFSKDVKFAKLILSNKFYNIKINNDFLKLAFQENGQNFVYFDGVKVGLDALGNILFGYNGQKAGFAYSTIENAAYLITLTKFPNPNDAEKNEIPDRVLYKAGWDISLNTEIGKVTSRDIMKILNPALEKSYLLSKENASPTVGIDKVNNVK